MGDVVGFGSRGRFPGVLRGVVVLCAVLGLSAGVLIPPASATAPREGLRVARLTVNGRVNPVGIGGAAPSFGWQLASSERGAWQSAYEIRVGRRPGAADVRGAQGISRPPAWRGGLRLSTGFPTTRSSRQN